MRASKKLALVPLLKERNCTSLLSILRLIREWVNKGSWKKLSVCSMVKNAEALWNESIPQKGSSYVISLVVTILVTILVTSKEVVFSLNDLAGWITRTLQRLTVIALQREPPRTRDWNQRFEGGLRQKMNFQSIRLCLSILSIGLPIHRTLFQDKTLFWKQFSLL